MPPHTVGAGLTRAVVVSARRATPSRGALLPVLPSESRDHVDITIKQLLDETRMTVPGKPAALLYSRTLAFCICTALDPPWRVRGLVNAGHSSVSVTAAHPAVVAPRRLADATGTAPANDAPLGVVGVSDAGGGLDQWMNALSRLVLGVVMATTADRDKFALMDLFVATDGPSWRNNSGWLSFRDPCDDLWFGVTCSGTNGTADRAV